MKISLTIEELVERWEWLIWGKGVKKFRISEIFDDGYTKSYDVTEICVDICGDCIVCSDISDNLFLNSSRLCIFLRKNILSIESENTPKNSRVNITFNDMYVEVKECYF